MRTIAVIGAGVSGLAAARRLARAGMQVTVFEAAGRVGGQLRTVEVAGRTVDVGAEAMHTAAPAALALVDRLGLGDETAAASTGTTWIWGDNGLRRLPAGFGPAGPTRLWPVLTARVLSPAGVLRAGIEPFLSRTHVNGDGAVGDYLDRRFGREVTDRLVDPLLGGLHSGDVRSLSLRAATPQLAVLADRHRSLLLRRRRPPASGPAFITLQGGMTRLAERLAEDLEEPRLRLGTEVTRLERAGHRTVVHDADGRTLEADGVVMAVPAQVAARLVVGASPAASEGLGRLRTASVAVAVLAYPSDAADLPAFTGTGMLVPSAAGRLIKAATFLTTKWPHLAGPGDVLVRASSGRIGDDRARSLDDDELVERLHADLCEATGLRVDPATAHVHRWPSTMPQLEVGHHRRIDAITAALSSDLPGVALAGAPYDGPGIAACLRSGTDAAERLVIRMEERRP